MAQLPRPSEAPQTGASSVRKINGPAAAPIELSDVAGSAILKRVAAACRRVGAALVVLLASAVADDVSDDVAAVPS